MELPSWITYSDFERAEWLSQLLGTPTAPATYPTHHGTHCEYQKSTKIQLTEDLSEDLSWQTIKIASTVASIHTILGSAVILLAKDAAVRCMHASRADLAIRGQCSVSSRACKAGAQTERAAGCVDGRHLHRTVRLLPLIFQSHITNHSQNVIC